MKKSDTSPKVLFEDPHLIVLSKPAGLLTQGGPPNTPHLVSWLQERWGRPYVGLIHRLDRNTSGLMVVAKRTKSARRLTQALQEGKICRIYQAVVSGVFPKEVQWTHWLKKNPETNEVKAFTKENPGSKIAILKGRLLKTLSENASLVEFQLETGRSHQIRVQSAFEGFPLLGDRKYGNVTQNLKPEALALHSCELSFPHPMTGETLTFKESFQKTGIL